MSDQTDTAIFKTCARCYTNFWARGAWQTLCRSCYTESKRNEGAALKYCDECRQLFSARGDWQKLCGSCYAARKERDIKAIKSERDAALNLVQTLRRELDMKRLELAMRPQERVIPADQWRRLVQLCHPDRHGNSQAANEATRWLMENRPE